MTLGQRIQAGRTALELSQEALGERLGVSRQAVSKWEADAAVPDTDKLIALSRLFGVTLNQLLQVEEPAREEAGGVPSIREEETAAEGLIGPFEALKRILDTNIPKWRSLAFLTAVLFLVLALGNAYARIAELEFQVARLEDWAVGARTEYDTKDLVRRFSLDFDFDQDIAYIDLTLSTKVSAETITFGVRGFTRNPVQGERQESGSYRAAVHVQGVESPFVLSATIFDGPDQWELPLAQVEDYSAKEKRCSWTSLY